jgi:hypothetical protein
VERYHIAGALIHSPLKQRSLILIAALTGQLLSLASPKNVAESDRHLADLLLWCPWRALADRLLTPWPSARAAQPHGRFPRFSHGISSAASDT